MNTRTQDESARTKLIEIATRLTDHEVRGTNTAEWLRAFRKNYRHMAVTTFGDLFEAATLGIAEKATDTAIEPKSNPQAA